MINVEKLLKEHGLTQEQIDIIKREVRREFPDDDMMYELHLIRLTHSFLNGYCTVQDIVESKVV